jgi:hypothetical protein
VLKAFASKLRLKLKDAGLETGNGTGVTGILFRYRFRYSAIRPLLGAVTAHTLG